MWTDLRSADGTALASVTMMRAILHYGGASGLLSAHDPAMCVRKGATGHLTQARRCIFLILDSCYSLSCLVCSFMYVYSDDATLQCERRKFLRLL